MKIITRDGSETFYNEEAKQCYHSVSGAIEEALKKHVEPSSVKKFAKNGKLKILDICFGIGYNSAVAIDEALKENPNCKIEITAIEKDPEIIKEIKNLNPEIKNYWMIKNFLVKKKLPENIKIGLLIEDLRTVLPKIEGKYDVVFFDPFSPRVVPELWTEKIFSQVFNLMKPGGRLTTYSCSSKVRVNMARAGFQVMNGPSIGRRAPSTIAEKLPSSKG